MSDYIDPNSGRAVQPGGAFKGMNDVSTDDVDFKQAEERALPQTPVVVEQDDQSAQAGEVDQTPVAEELESDEEASEEADEDETEDSYDPADYSVEDVKAFVEANPDQKEAVLASEKAGKNRSTLVAALEADE